ncbi:MAG: HEPN domain-containing protein [Candidatus Omnitrophota bacterium]
MKKTTKNWILSAEYDLKTAESLLKSRRKIYAIFLCHLAIEKTIKGVISEKQAKLPPYTHNLVHLFELAEVSLPEKLNDFVELINDKSVPMRYPEDILNIEKQFSMKLTKNYFKKTKEVLQWLRQNSIQLK